MDAAIYLIPPLALAAYYGWAISRVGRPAKPGPVVIQYQLPEGMSPAEARYAWKGCVDERSVACVLAQLAVTGRISLERGKGGSYELSRTDAPGKTAQDIAPEEQVALDWLFSNFLTRFSFHPEHDAQGLSMALRGALDRRLRGKYEATHYGYVGLGLMVSLGAAYSLAYNAGILSRAPLPMIYAEFMATLLAGIVITAVLVPALVDAKHRIGSAGRIIFGLAFSALGVAGAVGIDSKVRESAPAAFSFAVIALAALNVVPVPWLRRTTPQGIAARAQIEGYRQFLAEVEQDRLNRANPSSSQLQSKEALLPFAIALEVREAWGDALANACWPHMITG